MVSVLGPLDDAIAEQMKEDVLAVCRVPPPFQAKGFTVLPEKLSGETKLRFDDGELPQEWMDWWAAQVASIQARDGAALITLEPGLLGQHRVRPLSLGTLLAQMGTPTWPCRPAWWSLGVWMTGSWGARCCERLPAREPWVFTSTGAPPSLWLIRIPCGTGARPE